MKRLLMIGIAMLLLCGCIAESSVPTEETPEYREGYEQALDDIETKMEREYENNPPSAWEVFPEEMDAAYRDGYIEGYYDALNGEEPEFDIEE